MRWMTWMTMVALCAACGDDDSSDETPMVDAQVVDMNEPPVDQGDVSDLPVDSFVPGCTEGCAIVEVSAGSDFSCALRESGEILCWGANLYGQLGDGAMRHGSVCGMTGVEPLDCSATPVVVEDVLATSVESEGAGSCALDGAGTVQCWGLSDAVPVGSDVRSRLLSPEPRSGFGTVDSFAKGLVHTCGVKADGTLICAGQNEAGQIGNGDFDPHTEPVDLTLTGVVEVEVGGEFTCARTASAVHCWGANAGNQLGDDASHTTCGSPPVTYDCSSEPVEVAIDATQVTGLALGWEHACALMTDGTLQCWGFNAAGQVGVSAGASVAIPTEVAGLAGVTHVAAGRDTTCAIVGGGAVKCWGANGEGQLGDGVEVGGHETCNNVRGESIDCSGTPVDVDLSEGATAIAVGSAHVCAVGVSGSVYCWGWNDQRQLGPNGNTDRTRSNVPVEVTGF